MIQETKDTAANLTTIMGAGSALMGLSEILTLVLILTGIVLNVTRIWSIRKDKKRP